MKFISKKLVREFVDDNLFSDNLPAGYITDADLPDLFKKKYDVLASLGGSSAFYNNQYVFSEFWKIICTGHSYFSECLVEKRIDGLVICTLEIPLIARLKNSHLSDLNSNIWSELDKFLHWPRYVFYKLPIKLDPTKYFPVNLNHSSLPNSHFNAFHTVWKDTVSSAGSDNVIGANSFSDEYNHAKLLDAKGYTSRLLLIPNTVKPVST